jgi:hypothetical protein
VRITFTNEANDLDCRMMKLAKILPCLVIGACALCLLGCKKETRTDASRPLEQSFPASDPETKQALATATTSLKAGKYVEACRALEPLLARGKLTPQQREAVGLMFRQVNQAIAANPSLDSKELYELRVKLAKAARGDRF